MDYGTLLLNQKEIVSLTQTNIIKRIIFIALGTCTAKFSIDSWWLLIKCH